MLMSQAVKYSSFCKVEIL